MLIKLLPEQVAERWDLIRFALSESLPPVVISGPHTYNNILTTALCERMQVWFGVSEKDGKRTLDVIIVTTRAEDAVSGSASLLIYSMYAFSQLAPRDWQEYYEALSKYAKSVGCGSMSAYTENIKIINAAMQIRGSKQEVYLTIPI